MDENPFADPNQVNPFMVSYIIQLINHQIHGEHIYIYVNYWIGFSHCIEREIIKSIVQLLANTYSVDLNNLKNLQDPSVMQVSSQSTTVGAGLDDPFGAVSPVV